jgi:molecular chaperone DnaK
MERVCAGIDLGTTNSCLAVLEAGRPVVVPNDLGEPTTPSLVSVLADGTTVVGKKARSRLLTHPASTFASIKRRMGQRHVRTVLGVEYTPETVSALILQHLKRCAETRLDRSIDDVVITVPANFNSIQRQATKDAGEIAGFHVLRVLNEPRRRWLMGTSSSSPASLSSSTSAAAPSISRLSRQATACSR